MAVQFDALAQFRTLVSRRAKQSPAQWDASRRLIDSERFPSTLARLRTVCEARELVPVVHQHCRLALGREAHRVQDLDGAALKALTGLPPAKGFRALCLYFDLVESSASRWPVPMLSADEIHERVCRLDNPFDLLLESDVASVLDLGAGDLSFATELVDRYLPTLREQNRSLVLHCLDRLHPRSKLGGPLHPEQRRIDALSNQLGTSFAYFGNQDMFALGTLDDHGKLATRYTIVTCWAPATPTFAYEPTRLSAATITDHLRRTKGAFRQTRVEGEAALEVRHGERALLFPAWKFDIVGPLALLRLMAQRGCLCVLGAVDDQVFWEILAQLVEDSRYRPPDQPFSSDTVPRIFGDLYRALNQVPLGGAVDLADLTSLRRSFPVDDSQETDTGSSYAFRSIRIRRGATFPGVPASSTARKFASMAEEAPPWFLTLVPEIHRDEQARSGEQKA
jgi:hypothetical protein